MGSVVVKLGSSIVANDAGELRTDVLSALCDEVAARHEAGDEVVVVTSGAIARGMRLMELPMRPTTTSSSGSHSLWELTTCADVNGCSTSAATTALPLQLALICVCMGHLPIVT